MKWRPFRRLLDKQDREKFDDMSTIPRFLPVGQLEEIRHVSEHYIAKSNTYIVMVSTPNNPGGLFEQIENEPS